MYNAPTLNTYLSLIPSQHSDKPKFVALFSAIANSYIAVQQTIVGFLDDFYLETAVGVQLDAVGLWVGLSRVLKAPITGIFFTFDSALDGETWDTGIWKSRFEPGDALYVLPDHLYRFAIKLKILENRWDGTITQLYQIWDSVFGNEEIDLYIQDNQNMSFDAYFVSTKLSIAQQRIIEQSGLFPKPAGVSLNYIFTDTPPV